MRPARLVSYAFFYTTCATSPTNYIWGCVMYTHSVESCLKRANKTRFDQNCNMSFWKKWFFQKASRKLCLYFLMLFLVIKGPRDIKFFGTTLFKVFGYSVRNSPLLLASFRISLSSLLPKNTPIHLH